MDSVFCVKKKNLGIEDQIENGSRSGSGNESGNHSRKTGGAGGIRTHDSFNRIRDFQSRSFDHSDTTPRLTNYSPLNLSYLGRLETEVNIASGLQGFRAQFHPFPIAQDTVADPHRAPRFQRHASQCLHVSAFRHVHPIDPIGEAGD